MRYNIHEMLSKIVDHEKVIELNIDVYDFEKLSIDQKISLLIHYPTTFLEKLKPLMTESYAKIAVLSRPLLKKYHKQFEISEAEALTLDNEDYYSLIMHTKYFDRYANVGQFSKLKRYHQINLFKKYPDWVSTNLPEIPRLTSDDLRDLANTQPKFIDDYVKDLSVLTTTADFWLTMIKFSSRYENIFLANMDTCLTATEVRTVIRAKPHIIKKLTPEMLVDSILTVKQWILLINSTLSHSKKVFKDWTFSEEMIEAFRLDSVAEILSGTSTKTTRFQVALEGVMAKEAKTEIQKEIEEDED